MESDFSIRNELDSVVRPPDNDSSKYSGENPFSKLVDGFSAQQPATGSNAPPLNNNVYLNQNNNDAWKAQAFLPPLWHSNKQT